MRKNIFIVVVIICMLVIVTGCSDKENIIEKAVEELDYDVLVPSYVPSGLVLTDAVLEGDLFIQNYTSDDGSILIEISQNHIAKGLNINRLLEFLETGVDPYEKIPDKSYLQIGNFVGEYNVYNDSISYMFIPAKTRPKLGDDWYPSYWITSVGIDEEQFQKVIESFE